MRLNTLVASFAACGYGECTASKYFDPTTGITFSSITHANGVSYRIALPYNGTSPDSILQIVSPGSFAWCGLAWGGHMTNNPLSVTWKTEASDGGKVLVSSRMAFGYYAVPLPYESATYTVIHASVSPDSWVAQSGLAKMATLTSTMMILVFLHTLVRAYRPIHRVATLAVSIFMNNLGFGVMT
ncbi:hypothetical protein GQ44DRAFT_732217 [Phaeosphaeriaceae sp. PMI808]|nr:hypothetical protein GQ44DRAFT_732217 [Phaeosphaeriaceae sp. PMI808]